MFRERLFETARAVGADPLDLATVISYETGGTFDPKQPGPTTQWGQHRGLIQFGEPQARQHGVNWDDPLNSQLGPDGAVASYLRSSGYQPGMGLLDLYSTVNAGAPGLYNRSDANNGGAPGTVRDKVEQQMAGHRQNAMRLLEMDGEPQADQPSGGTMQNGQRPQAATQVSTKGLLGEDGDDERWFQRPGIWEALAMGFNSMRHRPDENLPRVIQANRNRRDDRSQQAEAEAEQREQMEQALGWLQSNNAPAEIMEGVAQGVIPAQEAVAMTLDQMRGPEMTTGFQTLHQRAEAAGFEPGSPEYQQMMTEGSAPQTNINVNTGQGEVGTIPPGYELMTDPETGARRFEPIPGGPVAQEMQDAQEQERGRDQQRARAGSTVIQDLQRARDLIPELGPLSGRDDTIGGIARTGAGFIPGSAEWPSTVANRITQFTESALSNVGLDTLQQMRENSPTGGALGQVPVQQQRRLEQVLGSLDISQPPETLDTNIARVQNIYTDIIHGTPEERARAVQEGRMTPEQSAEIDSYYNELPFDERGRSGQQQPGGGQASAPAGEQPPEILSSEDRELWPYMSEEDRQRVLREYEMNQ